MTSSELENFLYAQIPISRALGIRITDLEEGRAVVAAALAPNRNHLGTAFGGSLNAVAVVACYAWLFNVLQSRGLPFHVVIKSSQISYLKPVGADFSAECSAPDTAEVERFLKSLQRKSKGQLLLQATVSSGGELVCRFEGEFVAQ